MKYTRTLFRVLLVLGMVGALVFARDQKGQTRYKTASPAVANGPALTTLNINNIEVWVRRDAALPPDGANGARVFTSIPPDRRSRQFRFPRRR